MFNFKFYTYMIYGEMPIHFHGEKFNLITIWGRPASIETYNYIKYKICRLTFDY